MNYKLILLAVLALILINSWAHPAKAPKEPKENIPSVREQTGVSIVGSVNLLEWAKSSGYKIYTRPATEEDYNGRNVVVVGGSGGPATLEGEGNGGAIPRSCKTIWLAIDPKNPNAGGPGGCY